MTVFSDLTVFFVFFFLLKYFSLYLFIDLDIHNWASSLLFKSVQHALME